MILPGHLGAGGGGPKMITSAKQLGSESAPADTGEGETPSSRPTSDSFLSLSARKFSYIRIDDGKLYS